MALRWLLVPLLVAAILLVQQSQGASAAGLKAELRTKLLLSNIRSHLAKQVEEVAQQKECDSGLTLCEAPAKKEDASPEASEEDIPPPPKIRGSHKPVVKVSPKEVIQTMIHKAPKIHKSIDHEPHKIKKLKDTRDEEEKDDNDDDDDDDADDDEKVKKSKKIKSAKKEERESAEADGKVKKGVQDKKKTTKDKKSKAPVEEEEEEDGIRFPRDFPVFAATSTAVENELCRKHSRLFQRQLQRYKMWALMMYDATAKLPSGILQGNTNQLGDFDECLSVNAVLKDKSKGGKGDGSTPSIQGRYCLVSVDVEATADEGALQKAVDKAQAYGFIRSTAQDPGYFVPRFTTINWGVCVPSSCSHEDVEKALVDELSVYNDTAGVEFTIVVEESSCVDRDDMNISLSLGTVFTGFFYLAVISAAAIATYRDTIGAKKEVVVGETQDGNPESEGENEAAEETPAEKKGTEKEEEPKEPDDTQKESDEPPKQAGKTQRLLQAFSLKSSVAELLCEDDTKRESEITCVHGIKAVFTVMLYIAHKVVPTALTPYTNRIAFTKLSNEAVSTVLRTSIIYTDSFLLVSGVLTAFNITREVQRAGRVSWVSRILTRFIRLTPPLLAVVLWYGYISELLGSGPMWAPIVGKNAQVCRDNGWTNLLYLQNLFDFQEMCAPQTHQLALDMQLTATAPLLVFLLFKYDLIGLLLLQFIFLLSAALRYITTSSNNLTLVFFHGNTVSQLYDTANYLYTQAIYRATPYVMGVTIGYYLHAHGEQIQARLQSTLAAVGWIVAACLAALAVLAPAHLADRAYQYDAQEAAQYAALGPIAWSLALGWVIVACHLGYGGRLNSWLSSWPLLVLSRISYSVYLIQFLVFNHNVGVIRAPRAFSVFEAIDLSEVTTTLAAGCALTLLFDIPMRQVKSIVLEAIRERRQRAAEQAEAEESEAGQDQGNQEDGDKKDQPEPLIGSDADEVEDEPVRYPPDYEEELAEEEDENLRRSSRVRFDEASADEEPLEDEEEDPEDGGENFWGDQHD